MHRIEELTKAVRELTAAITATGTVPSAVTELKVAEDTKQAIDELAAATAKKMAKKPVATEPAATQPTAAPTAAPEAKEPTSAPAVVTEAPAAVAEAQTAEAQTAKPTAANESTYDNVRAAFMTLNQAKGRDATVAVLAELGAARVPDIKPADFTKAVMLAELAAR